VWPANGLEQVTTCPICGSCEGSVEIEDLTDGLFEAPGSWTYIRCNLCRSAYLSPRPNRNSIALAYERYITHKAPEHHVPTGPVRWIKRAVANGYRNHRFKTHLEPSTAVGIMLAALLPKAARELQAEARGLDNMRMSERRVLDVGCGSGAFLGLARQMGWNCFGMEVDPVAANVARAHGVNILGDQVEALDHSYNCFFDAVTLSHVIEHVFDPIHTLRECLRVLRPGGYLWLETPNLDSIGYANYRQFWRGFDTPRHLVLFNHQSLQLTIREAGFTDIRILPPRDVTLWMFTQSAALQHGVDGELDDAPLPAPVLKHVKQQLRTARRRLSKRPDLSEFITAVAYRPA
jgi:2-polyprenyl-3-methyl-5-hydroxy-6-metoxy-1,4-benzoquinol methylase